MMFNSFWILIFLVSLNSYANPLHTLDDVTTGTLSTPVSKEFKLYDFETVKGNKITQDGAIQESYNFIAPNEWQNYLFEGCLPKEGGAYISVGTFRALNVGSSPRVSHLVMMDLSMEAVIFNKINAQLIAKAKDRFQYLSYLFTGKEQSDLQDQARAGKIEIAVFMRELLDRRKPKEIEPIWEKELGVSLTADEWKFFKEKVFFNDGTNMRILSSFENIILTKLWDKTYIGNDKRFNKIREMIHDKKMTIIQGDISGEKSLKSLNEELRKADIKVAGIDYSNAPAYIENRKDRTSKMLDNIRALPFKEGGRIHSTNNATGARGLGADDWSYLSMPYKHLEGLKQIAGYQYPYPTLPAYPAYDYSNNLGTFKMDPDPNNPGPLYSSTGFPCDKMP